MPLVSVVIPSYNRASIIKRTIMSVLDQDISDIEIVVIDDGSTDNTKQIVNKINYPSLMYVYQENKGPGAARNKGIKIANGEFIAFLDSDDLFLANKINLQLSILKTRSDVGLVYGAHYLIDGNGKIIHKSRVNTRITTEYLLLRWAPFVTSTILIRRSWLERINYFDESPSLRRSEDWDLVIRLSIAGCQLVGINEPIVKYKLHNTNAMRDLQLMRIGSIAALNKAFRNPLLLPDLKSIENIAFSRGYLRLSGLGFALGETRTAQADLRKAIDLDPSLLDKNSEILILGLVYWAHNPLCSDKRKCFQKMRKNLPYELDSQPGFIKRLEGNYFMTSAFDLYSKGKLKESRRNIMKAIFRDKNNLKNKGLVSIYMESILGTKLMNSLRSGFKKKNFD